jgi:predicted phosphodiesterase
LVPLAPDPADTWPTLTFSTLPYEGPLRIVALGDSGFGDNTTPELAALMAAHQPHLFLHLGDVVYRMYENDYNAYLNWWLKYFRPFAPVLSQAPHALTFGNHDGERAAYLDGEPSYELMYPLPDAPPGQRWHSFMMANIRFICLDSQVYFSYPSLIEPQEQWLEQTLAQDQGKYTIVFFHVPPFNSSDLHYDATDVIAQRIVPRLESANVPLTLSAHAHIYERVIHNGRTYIVAGAGGASIYGEGIRHPESQVMVSRASYPYIECHDDHIRLTAYDIAGDVIDDVRIEVG